MENEEENLIEQNPIEKIYSKNFDEWNDVKKVLEKDIENFLEINERELWWCSLGINLGDEEDGKNNNFERPVLIIKKFNNRVVWILPLTTRPGHLKYYFGINYRNIKSYAILSQLRLISVKRLKRMLGRLSPKQFYEIRKIIISFLK
jgi:mRNA interferase MazF